MSTAVADTAASAEFEVQVEALTQIDSIEKEWKQLLQLRETNLPAGVSKIHETQSAEKLKLKPDLKKSTAFVKKIKANINTDGINQCLRDVEAVNLTQFIEEIVNAIVATNYKAADASLMVRLCMSLHHKYKEFHCLLITSLKHSLIAQSLDPNEAETGKKKRIQIRFLIEIYQLGLFAEDDFFCTLLRHILGRDSKSNAKGVVDVQSLSTFVKYGCEVLMGFRPRKMIDLAAKASKQLEELPNKTIAPMKVSNELKMMVSDTYQQLCRDLVAAHRDYFSKEARMEKDKLIHGSLTEQKQNEWDNAKRIYEKLLVIVTAMSECIGQDMPVLEVEKEQTDGSGGLSVWEGSGPRNKDTVDSDASAAADGGYYGDPETRAFYEDLPDLLSSVPLAVLGLTAEQAAALKEKWQQEKNEATTGGENGDGSSDSTELENMDYSAIAEDVTNDDGDAPASEEIVDDVEKATGEEEDATKEGDVNNNATAPDESKAAKLQLLLNEKLPECISKSKADDFSVAFCYVATKNARKRLSQALLRIPRTRLELAPYYARIAATLKQLYPDIVKPLLEGIQKEFYGMMKTKNQYYVDNKVKNVRFQGELIKFHVAPPIVAFRMFKSLLSDFSPHNVQLLAASMESCGRFLYLLPYTQQRMNNILETMMKLRRARHVDLQQQTLLDSAYFAVKPPERTVKANKIELSTVQKYARYLILEKLDEPRTSVEVVIKSLRRLPWQNKDTSEGTHDIPHHVVTAALKLARSKYVSIPNLADCLSGLSNYQPNVTIILVDRILEEVQRSLDSPYKREIQRTLGYIRLLGELYNFMVVTSQLMFHVLYYLISFGHETPLSTDAERSKNANIGSRSQLQGGSGAMPSTTGPNKLIFDPTIPSETDLPNDLFRAQIVCEILNTCGMYYVRGALKEKLKRFLVFFQYYLLTKQFVPLHIEFLLLDTFDNLEEMAQEAEREGKNKKKKSRKAVTTTVGPVFVRFDSIADAKSEVDRYIEQETEKIMKVQMNDSRNEGNTNQDALQSTQSGTAEQSNELKAAEFDEGDDEEGDEDEDDEEEERRVSRVGNDDQQVGDGEEYEDDDDDDDDEEDDDEEEEDDDDDSSTERRAAEEEQAALEMSEREAAKMMEKLRVAEEDEEFEKAFKYVMQESITSVAKKPTNDANRMAIPVVLPKPKNTFRSSTLDTGDEEMYGNGDDDFTFRQSSKVSTVPFKLLSRDGKGRIEARQLMVPEDNKMAIKLAQAEKERKEEKQRLKEQILQLEKLSAETDERESYVHQQQYAGGGRALKVMNPYRGHRGGSGSLRAEETRKAADSLNLDEFLAESNAAELRKIHNK